MAERGIFLIRNLKCLTSLTIDINDLYCPIGCCRLAVLFDLMERFLGKLTILSHGLPVFFPSLKELKVRGLKDMEEVAVFEKYLGVGKHDAEHRFIWRRQTKAEGS